MAVHSDVRSTIVGAMPSIELPAPADQLAARAAELLGWSGVVLPPVTLLGRRVRPVAELLTDRHAERLCWGGGPVTDRVTVSTWAWPEMADRAPLPAVRISGVLVPARHWRTALASAVPFARFCNTAVVLPTTVTDSEDFLVNGAFRARYHGIGMIAATDADELVVLHSGRTERPYVEDTATYRWVHEVVYAHLLDTMPQLAADLPADC